jgi:hypothetical protein
MFDEWDSPQAFAQREAERRADAERDRQAMCDLLRHRGHDAAALVVAASKLTSDCVDNWDGGQYEVTLAVPAVMYDGACTEAVKAELTAVAEAVVTAKHFRGLEISLRRGDAPPGWDATAFAEIMDASRHAASAANEQPAHLTA